MLPFRPHGSHPGNRGLQRLGRKRGWGPQPPSGPGPSDHRAHPKLFSVPGNRAQAGGEVPSPAPSKGLLIPCSQPRAPFHLGSPEQTAPRRDGQGHLPPASGRAGKALLRSRRGAPSPGGGKAGPQAEGCPLCIPSVCHPRSLPLSQGHLWLPWGPAGHTDPPPYPKALDPITHLATHGDIHGSQKRGREHNLGGVHFSG